VKDRVKALKDWNKSGLKDVLFPRYVFNKPVFRVALLLCFVVLGVLLYKNNFDFERKFYYYCPSDSGGCINPFYQENLFSEVQRCPINDSFFCDSPSFNPGFTYGTPPSQDINLFAWFSLVTFAVAFLYNHLKYNYKRGGRSDC
jgi:hypothetical protein